MDPFEFSDDEFAILERVVEDAYAFRELMFIQDSEERDPIRASAILASFVDRGLVEIEEREDEGKERLLTPDEACAAIADPANRTDPLDPPTSIIQWHQAWATPAGRAAFERAVRERQRE